MELKFKKKSADIQDARVLEDRAAPESAQPKASAGFFARKAPSVSSSQAKPARAGFSWGRSNKPADKPTVVKSVGKTSGRAAGRAGSRLFLCEPADLELLPAKTRERVYLMGDVAPLSLQGLGLGPDYFEQPPRNAAGVSLLQRRVSRPLYVSAHREVLSAVLKAGAKPVFAVDALLRYGAKLRGGDEQVVVAATGHGEVVHLLAMLFRRAELVDLKSWRVVSGANTQAEDLHLSMERLRVAWPNAQRWHWCGPLPAPASQMVVEAPDSLWSHAPSQSLTTSGRPSVISRFGLPVFLVLASVGGAVAMVWPPYQDYLRSAQSLANESQSLTGQYAFASQRLQLLRARQEFFRSAEAPQQRLKRLEAVLQAVGQQNLKVREAQLYAQPQGRGQFELVVEIEPSPGQSFLEQSKDILEQLATDTGAKLWLAQNNGFKEVSSKDTSGTAVLRQFRIQGDFAHGS
jgi:hypothetical protein